MRFHCKLFTIAITICLLVCISVCERVRFLKQSQHVTCDNIVHLLLSQQLFIETHDLVVVVVVVVVIYAIRSMGKFLSRQVKSGVKRVMSIYRFIQCVRIKKQQLQTKKRDDTGKQQQQLYCLLLRIERNKNTTAQCSVVTKGSGSNNLLYYSFCTQKAHNRRWECYAVWIIILHQVQQQQPVIETNCDENSDRVNATIIKLRSE